MLRHPHWIFSVLFGISVVLYAAGVARVGSVLWGDTLYYYAYTRSLVVDQDLNFINESFRVDGGFPHPPEISPVTGLITNKFSVGAPLLWIPSFVVAQVASWSWWGAQALWEVVKGLEPGRWQQFLQAVPQPDGYDHITQFGVGLGAIGLSVLGLVAVFAALQDWLQKVSRLSTALATRLALIGAGVLYLTTQLFYYTSVDPLNSHSASFLLSSLLLWVTVRGLISGWTAKKAWLVGLLAGGLFLVRPQDVLVAAPVLVALAFYVRENLLTRVGLIIRACLPILATLGLSQAIVWYFFGQLGSPYLIRGEQFSWFRPDFLRVLFSPSNGLFFFAPLTVVMLAGVLRFVRQGNPAERRLGSVALAVFCLQLYVIAAWGREILGGPYGSRMFMSSLPWLAVGMLSWLEGLARLRGAQLRQFGWRWLWIVLAAGVNNLVQTVVMLVRF